MGVLKHNVVDIGDDFIGNGGMLAIFQDTIIGVDFTLTSQVPPFYCLKPERKSLSFYHFGSKGQGPNEFLEPYSIQCINTNIVGTYDRNTGTYYEFTVPREKEKLKINKKIRFENRRLDLATKTAFNQHIGLNRGGGESMFILADSMGKTVNMLFDYPYKNNDERERFDNKRRFFAYQGSLAVNPSKTKLAYTARNGDIIHFYSIENNTIQLIAKIENEYPIYSDPHNPIVPTANATMTLSVMLSPESLRGYVAIYATEQFVYALFNGTKLEEKKLEEATILRVFDWNGNLVKVYDLDIPSRSLCVSDDDSKLWTIAVEPEISLVYFEF